MTIDIVLDDVTKVYNDAGHRLGVIQNLSFLFPAGKTIAIMGRSGVGKSTLLHLLGLLDTPTSGRVSFGSSDVTKMNDEQRSRFRGKHVGFVFQAHHLLPEFSAAENVALPLIIAGETRGKAISRAKELLTRVGLSERTSHRPGQLSGGEQQRVAIARALVAEPAVVLADEPTGNLDLKTATEVQDLLRNVNRQIGSTLIIVTHSAELAAGLDIVVEMSAGGVLAQRNNA